METLLIVFLTAVIVALVLSLFSRMSQGRRISDIESMLSEAVPISVAFRAKQIKKLTHAHTPELDELLTRIDELSDEEEVRFAQLLKERIVEMDDPEIDQEEREAAAMLPALNRMVRAEKAIKDAEVQVVLIPPAGKPPDKGKRAGR